MAFKALIIAVFAAAVCLGVDGSELSVNSTTTVTDGKGQLVAVSNVTIVASGSGYNHTSDSAMLNGFVQSQFDKLQKNPEQFADSDSFGGRRPPPPSGGLVLSYTLEVHTQFNIGPSPTRTLKFYMRTEIYARKKKNHEALFALRAPTF